MPWTAADAKTHIKGLSSNQSAAWAKIANSSLSACLKDGGSQKTCEGRAVRIANSQAKKVGESKGGENMYMLVEEAKIGSLDDLMKRVRAAVRKKYESPFNGESLAWVFAIFPKYVIVEEKGDYFKIPYTDSGKQVTLGNPTKVDYVETFKAVKEAQNKLTGGDQKVQDLSFNTSLIETSALDQSKGIYEVTIIKEGFTEDKKRYYPKDTLTKATSLFEGAKAYADHPTKQEMKDRPERSIADLIGDYRNVRCMEDSGKAKIKGELHILESKSWVKDVLNRAVDNPSFCGTSIHADGWVNPKAKDGSDLVESIETVASADIVTEANAGGRVERLIASNRKDINEEDNGKKEGGAEELKIAELSVEQLQKERPDLFESMKKDFEKQAGNKNKELVDKDELATLREAKADVEKLTISTKITESKILDVIKKKEDKEKEEANLTAEMTGKSEEDMDKVIEGRKAFISSIGVKITGNPAKEDQEKEGKGYHIGSILTEAKTAYRQVYLDN